MSKNNKIPPIILFVFVVLFIIAITGNYFSKIVIALLLAIVIFKLFWKEKSPPIIVFALLFQWLSISIGYIYLSISSLEHADLLRRPEYALENIDIAYWLSLLGLLFFMLGLKIALLNHKFKSFDKNLLKEYDTLRVIVAYIVVSFGTGILFESIRFLIPGLSEPAAILKFFKWSLFFLMIYLSFTRNERKNLVYIIIVFEIIIGFTSIFSEFKDYFILFPLVYLSFNKLKLKQSITIAILAVIIINLGIIWSYVKGEQRMFLSGGKRQQIVTVSKVDALKNLYKLTKDFNSEKYELGLIAMVQRIYYIEYFSATIKNIPARQPFFQGEIWNRAVKHVLMPRMFFPNKEFIDDSKQTSLLTGIKLADAKQGTSISVGYMAESYADFGKQKMFIPIFILGFIIGFIYKKLSNSAINSLWSMAIVFPTFYIMNINGMNSIKVAGKVIMFFIVFMLLNKFVVPWLDKMLKRK